MTRDPLLPVHKADGVWTTEGAPPSTQICDPYPPPWVKVVSLDADQSTDATERDPGIMAPWMPWGYDKTEPRQWAKPGAEEGTVEIGGQTFRAVMTWTPPRSIFAAVALDGSGVWSIGDSEQEARAGAVGRRGFYRGLGCVEPPPETDAAWLDTLALVTLSGTTESLRAIVAVIEAADPVAPWCPADLWDSGEVKS